MHQRLWISLQSRPKGKQKFLIYRLFIKKIAEASSISFNWGDEGAV